MLLVIMFVWQHNKQQQRERRKREKRFSFLSKNRTKRQQWYLVDILIFCKCFGTQKQGSRTVIYQELMMFLKNDFT